VLSPGVYPPGRERALEPSSSSSLDRARSSIRLRFGEQALVSATRLSGAELWPSGLALDQLSGVGGLPRGRLSGISGPPGSGKTSVALAVLAHASREMTKSVVIDPGRGFDPWALAQFQPDLDALVVLQPPAQGMAEAALALARAGCGLILLLGEPPENVLVPLEGAAARSNSLILIVSESFSSPLAHAISMGFEARPQGWIEERGQLTGLRTQLTCSRNRLAPPGREIQLEVRWSLGGRASFECLRAVGQATHRIPGSAPWARSAAV